MKLFFTLSPYFRRLKIMQKPKLLLDPALLKSWSMQQVITVAVALGYDQQKAALAFLATITQEDFDEYLIFRPGPPSAYGPIPKRLVVKTVTELTAVAKQAAKEGKDPSEIYPDWQRDVDRRMKEGPERDALMALARGNRIDSSGTEMAAYVADIRKMAAVRKRAGLEEDVAAVK